MINNYNMLNITKLDVLDDLEEIRIGVAYTIDGHRLPKGAMPSTLETLAKVEVEYESESRAPAVLWACVHASACVRVHVCVHVCMRPP